MKDILKGELVRLSAADPQELGKAYSVWNNDSELTRLFDARSSRLISAKAIAKNIEKYIGEDSPAQYFFTIRRLGDNRLLGDIGLDVINNWGSRDSFVGLGICDRKDWGRGYGTDAMKILLRYAFVEINLGELQAHHLAPNPPTIRVSDGHRQLEVLGEVTPDSLKLLPLKES